MLYTNDYKAYIQIAELRVYKLLQRGEGYAHITKVAREKKAHMLTYKIIIDFC